MRLQTKRKCFLSLSVLRTPILLTPSANRKVQNNFSNVKAISRAPASVMRLVVGGGSTWGGRALNPARRVQTSSV